MKNYTVIDTIGQFLLFSAFDCRPAIRSCRLYDCSRCRGGWPARKIQRFGTISRRSWTKSQRLLWIKIPYSQVSTYICMLYLPSRRRSRHRDWFCETRFSGKFPPEPRSRLARDLFLWNSVPRNDRLCCSSTVRNNDFLNYYYLTRTNIYCNCITKIEEKKVRTLTFSW